MQRLQQTAFADDIRCAVRFLSGQKPRRRHRAGEDIIFMHVNPQSPLFNRNITPRALAVVGQKHERDIGILQFRNKPLRAGDELIVTVNHTVHINEIAKIHKRNTTLLPELFCAFFKATA